MIMTIEATQPVNSPRVYKLNYSLDRFLPENTDAPADSAYDGFLDEFPGWKKLKSGFYAPVPVTLGGIEGVVVRQQDTNGKWPITEIRMPEQIRFYGDKDFLRETDYLYTKPSWPIMSKQMLEVLLSVRDFPHQTIPIVIEDATLKYFSLDSPRTGIVNHDYVIVHLLEHLDALDLENSTYFPNLTKEPSNIMRFALKEPANSFPPIFRVVDDEVSIYVSAEAKTALEAAGIKGVEFSTYQVSSIPYSS
jgi:hypothetical protein